MVFSNREAAVEHKKICELSQGVKNVCTFENASFEMCARYFQHTVGLYEHVKKAHNRYICVKCDGVFRSLSDVEKHEHTSKKEDIHEGSIIT